MADLALKGGYPVVPKTLASRFEADSIFMQDIDKVGPEKKKIFQDFIYMKCTSDAQDINSTSKFIQAYM